MVASTSACDSASAGATAADSATALRPPDGSHLTRALLARCRDSARQRLGAVLADSVQAIEDDLFKHAGRASTGAEQQACLDAMMHLRRHRTALTETFERHFVEVFDRRVGEHGIKDLSVSQQLRADQLKLVETDAYDETLAVNELGRLTSHSLDADERWGLRARVGHLVKGEPLEERDNPFAPETVFEALRLACSRIPGDFAVKRALLNAFQPYVARGMAAVYADLNRSLIRHQVLPSIPRTLERVSATGRQRVAVTDPSWGSLTQSLSVSQMMNAEGEARAQGDARGAAQRSSGLPAGADLARALAAALDGPPEVRHVVAKMLAEPQRYGCESALARSAPPEVLATLTSLQGAPLFGEGGLDYAAAIAAAVRPHGQPLDLLTVEFVSLVFEHILGEAAIAEPVKAQIARLQIVAVKAAILDRTFFARREHPCRRLLDAIARAAADPEIDGGADSAFVRGLRDIIAGVTDEFQDDLSVFPRAERRLEQLTSEIALTHRASFQDAARAIESKERAEIAQTTAAAEVRRRLSPTTPAFVGTFLTRYWAKALAQSYLDESTGDDSWTHRLGVVDALVWSVGPLSRSEVSHLATMLPTLMRGLTRGMAAIEMPESARQLFFNELMAVHTSAIESMKTLSRTQPMPIFAPDVPDETGRPASASPVLAGDGAALDYFEHAVFALERGTVVEFVDDDKVVRSKLSWVSPNQTIYVFTSSMAPARQVAPRSLADQLRSGKARILDASEALIDRIVRTVVGGEPVDRR